MNPLLIRVREQAEARVAGLLETLQTGDRRRIGASLRQGLVRLALASDFALEELARQPILLSRLKPRASGAPAFDPDQVARAAIDGRLGELRRADSVLQIWRDVHGLDDAMQTCARATRVRSP